MPQGSTKLTSFTALMTRLRPLNQPDRSVNDFEMLRTASTLRAGEQASAGRLSDLATLFTSRSGVKRSPGSMPNRGTARMRAFR